MKTDKLHFMCSRSAHISSSKVSLQVSLSSTTAPLRSCPLVTFLFPSHIVSTNPAGRPPLPSSHQPNTCYTFPLRPCIRCRCLEKSVWLTSTKVGRCLEGYQAVMREWDHRIWTGIGPPTDWGECEETQELLLSILPPAGLRIQDHY